MRWVYESDQVLALLIGGHPDLGPDPKTLLRNSAGAGTKQKIPLVAIRTMRTKSTDRLGFWDLYSNERSWQHNFGRKVAPSTLSRNSSAPGSSQGVQSMKRCTGLDGPQAEPHINAAQIMRDRSSSRSRSIVGLPQTERQCQPVPRTYPEQLSKIQIQSLNVLPMRLNLRYILVRTLLMVTILMFIRSTGKGTSRPAHWFA